MSRIEYYIGHTMTVNDRYDASSGGIGTAVLKYLLSSRQYGTTITFIYDCENSQYVPKMVYDEGEINVCGSIYQDIDLIGFIRDNLCLIRNGIVITCPPCQVLAIRHLLEKKGIPNFIVSFCCSGQTVVEGTWKYLELQGIDKKEVKSLQYRGKGWPSGIRISMNNGTEHYFENYTEPWVSIQKSGLYTPSRCLFCKRDTGREADLCLADPWLDEYVKNDCIGNTLFLCTSEIGRDVVGQMNQLGHIDIVESCYDDYALAQEHNVKKEQYVITNLRFLKIKQGLLRISIYRKIVGHSLFTIRMHSHFMDFLSKLFTKRNFLSKMTWVLERFRKRIRSFSVSRKINHKGGYINVGKNVQFNCPQCIYIGLNVGIGDNTFFGPVVKENGIVYNPKIIIGDNCWIGKFNSFAAIDRIQIGNNVLFAGQVHITDHSHGYEDVSRPISPQRLISKGGVVIEDDCWLGFACEVLSGVTIGKHSIVAARAVVTKDVPAYSIVAGNPARIVKKYNFESQVWETVKHS